jgi:Flp pilus assembly protein TadB
MSHEIVPQTPILDKQTYSAPISYIGSTRRVMKWADRDRGQLAKVAVWTAVILGLVLVWAFVTVWYVVVLGVFGIFTFPYRLIRRSQRKTQHLQRAQLAAMQTLMAGQMKQPPDEPGGEPPGPRQIRP